jgi:hypothetical protein
MLLSEGIAGRSELIPKGKESYLKKTDNQLRRRKEQSRNNRSLGQRPTVWESMD